MKYLIRMKKREILRKLIIFETSIIHSGREVFFLLFYLHFASNYVINILHSVLIEGKC